MCTVIAFDHERRAADETAKRAHLLGYGLCSTQTFQRDAVRMARTTDLPAAKIARQCVPSKRMRMAEWHGDDVA